MSAMNGLSRGRVLGLTSLLAAGLSSQVSFAGAQHVIDPKPVWTVDIANSAGSPVLLGSAERCQGILVSRADGTISRFSTEGKLVASMRMDLPGDSPCAIADLKGDGKRLVVSFDCQGSIYAFDLNGARRWKYTLTGKTRDFRVPVTADLDGDGKREVLVSDSRGSIRCLTPDGKLRLKIDASHYRVASPAVGDIGGGLRGLVYGTEAGDIECVDRTGTLLWSRHLGGGFGRALPLLLGGPDPVVLIPRGFPDSSPALCALRARDGKLLWKAPCASQAYHSLTAASIAPGQGQSILFGDKHTRLYCLDPKGNLRWKTQLGGRGVFFTPAIADLNGDGNTTLFVEVRGESDDNKALFVLDDRGAILESLPLPGGGSCAPLILRPAAASPLQLLTLTGGKLSAYNISQGPSARVVWSGIRNDSACSGEVPAANSAAGQSSKLTQRPNGAPAHAMAKADALATLNSALVASSGAETVGLRLVGQQESPIRLHVLHPQSRLSFAEIVHSDEDIKGAYAVDVRRSPGTGSGEIKLVASGTVFLEGSAQRSARAIAQLSRLATTFVGGHRSPEVLAALDEQLTAARNDYAQASKSKGADFVLYDRILDTCEHAGLIAQGVQTGIGHEPLSVKQLTNPWKSHSLVDLLLQSQPGPIRLELPGNAYGSAAIAVTNLSGYAINLHTEVEAANAPASVLVVSDCLQAVPAATGIPVEDPLPTLTAGNAVMLRPGDSHKLWLTLSSEGLTAGLHKLKLRLGDAGSIVPPTDVPVELTVLPISLPQRHVYRHINWLYLASISDPLLREKTLRNAVEHGTSVFNVPQCSVSLDVDGNMIGQDTALHDSIVNSLKGRAEFVIDGSVGVSWPAGFTPSETLAAAAFAEAVHWYAGHMHELGIPYADYALYIMDEPALVGADGRFRSFVDTIHRVKAADPQMRIFCNPAGGATAAVLAPIAEEVDIWCPDMHLVKTQPQALQDLFKHRGEYWHYEAPADQRSLDPLGFYRMQAWTAFRYGMNGGGYWVYSGTPDWFPDPMRNGEYGAVYITPAGPVNSKRWEGTREGIQDFELLWMLRERAHAVGGARGEEALRIVNTAVSEITRGQEKATDITRQAAPFGPDYNLWMRYRSQIVQELLRLK